MMLDDCGVGATGVTERFLLGMPMSSSPSRNVRLRDTIN